jgi:hypothetical protein
MTVVRLKKGVIVSFVSEWASNPKDGKGISVTSFFYFTHKTINTMRNTILPLAALLLISSSAFAQKHKDDAESSGYVIAGGGGAIPLGEFQNDGLSDKQSGFAQTGAHSFLEFAMPIDRSNFGVAVNLSYYKNDINTVDIQTQLENKYSGTSVTVNTDGYQLTTVTGGLYLTFPVQKFSFDIKLLAGIALAKFPNVTTKVEDVNTGITASEHSATTSSAAFAFGGNLTIRYAITDHFCIFLQSGAIHTDVDFRTASTNSIDYTTNVTYGDQPMTLVHFSGGLGFQF